MNCATFKNKATAIKSFKDDLRGGMTVFGLFFFLFSGILGAIAVDVTSLYAARTHLQIAADQAAHAALYNATVIGKDEDDAKLAAIALVSATLPLAKYGITIEPEDIQFGKYNATADAFTTAGSGVDAVRAQTSFSDEHSNSAPTFLFRLIRLRSFEIYADSIFATYDPECLSDGFVANDVVNMQNQNFFGKGTCVHSNSKVELQVNNQFEQAANEFEQGATLSMPGGEQTVVVPGDKIEDVDGLVQALADGDLDIRVLDRIENMIYQYQNPTGTDFPHPGVSGDEIGWPSYIHADDRTMQTLVVDKTIDSNALAAGGVYYVECGGNGTLTIESGNGGTAPLPVLTEVVLITPCKVSFGQGSSVQNARVISLSDHSKSFSASNGLSLGSVGSDGCEENGAQLISMGGMDFAGNFTAYGSQAFSMGDIKFAATPSAPNDFKGISIVADGRIDMASHVNLQAGCDPSGAGEQITASYFRMVR